MTVDLSNLALQFSFPLLGEGSLIMVLWAWALFFLPLPLLALLLSPVTATAGRALLVPANSVLKGFAEVETSSRRFSGVTLLALVCWLMLVAALARPQWQGPPTASPVTGRDLMMGIDISKSMNESDLYAGNQQYSRMDVVRTVAAEFVQQRSGDRIGLIMFGSQAYVQTPLTFDHQTVAHFLSQAQVGLAGPSTAIGDAIGLGVKRLRDRPQESRVMILLTDGANSAGVVEPLDAARVAKESGIRIHTIGVGSERGRSALGFQFRAQRSQLDEKTLIKIAEITGGEYFRARDVAELQNIYRRIDEIEPTDSEEDQYRPLKELFVWPLGLALLLSGVIAVLKIREARV